MISEVSFVDMSRPAPAVIYKLRSRATCDQNEIDVRMAGRSVVVAEIFGISAADVRDIW